MGVLLVTPEFKDLKIKNFIFLSNTTTHKRIITIDSITLHCVKSVHIWSYSGPYFPAFGLNTERYGISLRIQSECGKIRNRITPNTDTIYTVLNKTSEYLCAV